MVLGARYDDMLLRSPDLFVVVAEPKDTTETSPQETRGGWNGHRGLSADAPASDNDYGLYLVGDCICVTRD